MAAQTRDASGQYSIGNVSDRNKKLLLSNNAPGISENEHDSVIGATRAPNEQTAASVFADYNYPHRMAHDIVPHSVNAAPQPFSPTTYKNTSEP